MGTTVVGTSVVTVNPGTALVSEVPRDVLGELAQEGDLLLFAYCIMNDAAHNATDFRTALTLPDGWQHAGFTTLATNRVIFAFKYREINDPDFYTFNYLSSNTMVGLMVAVRGPARDYNAFTPVFTPTNFTLPNVPFSDGFFAPTGSVGGVANATSASLTTISGSFPHTVPAATRVVYVAMAVDTAGLAPLFDDPVPLPMIHQYVRPGAGLGGDSMTVMLMDVEYATGPQAPPSAVTIAASASKAWIVASIAVEAFDVLDGTEDNYKGKVMRGLLKDPWDTEWGSGISDILTVVGSIDNDIGGLFGDEDFLPDGDV